MCKNLETVLQLRCRDLHDEANCVPSCGGRIADPLHCERRSTVVGAAAFMPGEKQITCGGNGHIISNAAAWSPDGEWVVYDIRSDRLGSQFDGTRIERVHVATGRVEVLYGSRDGACCGVATYSPIDEKVVFILGPGKPAGDWRYSAFNRRGVIVDPRNPGVLIDLDARESSAALLPGATARRNASAFVQCRRKMGELHLRGSSAGNQRGRRRDRTSETWA